MSAKDYFPATGSDLINNGAATTPTITDYPFENPLFPPTYIPPQEELIDIGTAESRPSDGAIDIGAFEFKTTDIISKNISKNLLNNVSIYPNPFTHSATITYYQTKPGDATITIYTGNGQNVKSFYIKRQNTGFHSVRWDGFTSDKNPVKSGVFIISIKEDAILKSFKIIKH